MRGSAARQSRASSHLGGTLPYASEATPTVVADLYREGYHLGLKGITLYRYGSITKQVLQLGAGEEPYEKEYTPKCDPHQCKL